ncbi:MAG: hypothetical protein Fur002_11420 [Anaerolineales bacterium]
MIRRAGKKSLFWFLIAALTLSCAPTLLASSTPAPLATFDPRSLETAIVSTAQAAATQTFLHTTPTLTPTLTRTPTSTITLTPSVTSSPTVTATNTFVFLLPTPTPLALDTPTKAASGGGGHNATQPPNRNVGSGPAYYCKIVSQSPANGTIIPLGTNFTAHWTLTNNGLLWEINSVDYVFVSGSFFAGRSTYDLPASVPRFGSVDISIDMRAPSKAGSYSSRWSLKRGHYSFCYFVLSIVVQ